MYDPAIRNTRLLQQYWWTLNYIHRLHNCGGNVFLFLHSNGRWGLAIDIGVEEGTGNFPRFVLKWLSKRDNRLLDLNLRRRGKYGGTNLPLSYSKGLNIKSVANQLIIFQMSKQNKLKILTFLIVEWKEVLSSSKWSFKNFKILKHDHCRGIKMDGEGNFPCGILEFCEITTVPFRMKSHRFRMIFPDRLFGTIKIWSRNFEPIL